MPPYTSPFHLPLIQLDPSATGQPIRLAFLLESLLNLFTIPLITHPQVILPYILLDPKSITHSTLFFARLFGGLVVGALTTALWCGLPNTKPSIDSRPTTYILLAAGEMVLIPLLILEAMKGGKVERGAVISVKGCLGVIACLAPPLAWRVWVLGFRRELMGRYREVEVGKKDE
jgi:hypothetical protein